MNNPYDLVKKFYSPDWKKVNDRDKAKNFFMVNRICSIRFPLQANALNHIKIQPDKSIDFWKIFLTSQEKSSPSWIWTKSIKKDKVKEKNYKEEVINFIKEKNQISNREIKELIEFSPKKFSEYYKSIESLLSQE